MTSEPRILSSQPLREGWPPISEEEVELPSGARKRWIRMHFGTSAAVLAVTPQKQIVLTRTAYLEGTLHLFFAKECQATERRPNPDEIQSVERISVTSALSSARGGEFESAVVTLAILMADARGWLIT